MATRADLTISEIDVQTINVESPASANLTGVANRHLALAQAYKITSPQLYAAAADDLQAIKGKLKAWDDLRKKFTKPLDDLKQQWMDLFRSPIDTLKQAEQTIKNAMLAFDEEQERIRKAEEERRLAEQRAEEQRAAEAARQAQQALESAKTPDQVAEASAKLEQATVRQAEIQHTPAPIVASATPKVAGISKKTTWRGECTDKMALIKAVAAGNAPITLLDVNESVLNQMARAMKETMNFPGCRAVEDKGIASSRR